MYYSIVRIFLDIQMFLFKRFMQVVSFFVFVWFDSLRPLNNLSVMRDGSSWVKPVLS